MPNGQRLRLRAALRGRALRVAGAFACVMLAFGSGALAQAPLEVADRAYEEGRIPDAAREYEAAIEAGDLEPVSLVRAYLRLGILAALAGETQLSDARFAAALALDPVRDVPEELGDAERARFEALREERAGRRVSVAIDAVGDALEVDVRHAPPGMAAAIVVRGAQGFERRIRWEGAPIRVEVPPSAMPIEALLVDAHGNRLARAGARTEPVVAVATTPVPDERRSRNLFESPWLWVVVGAIVIGIGVTIGVGASGDVYVLEAPVIR